ncbi:hypothetical protein GGI25_003912 [Coemansia spiralis]|uniref:ADF-H domain-containing protein n=2 Tax=Coemansia TaxID=4863 RepID=A0A9W8G5Q3_9FUNG|nr:glia maturation factor, beta, isoform CRA_a [Coemansia spiralis]KAJ1985781.1 hypothetical protein EDC05_006503 [Coemansia umbellata]KAJ2620923.1 hypothetical protein GGI26_004529 [Coemansia sp. RSA 1358]KAJ2675495.1 hypothetical protein GGI25_003912 [Coemansia spiralis]
MASVTCTIEPSVLEDVKKFRLKKPSESLQVYVAKIDRDSQTVVHDETFESIGFDELVEELPEDAPRYVIVSYRHQYDDGRVSYPLVFIYYCPVTSAMQTRMLYASTQQLFEKEAELGKSYMLQNKDELNKEWLDSNLNKFAS